MTRDTSDHKRRIVWSCVAVLAMVAAACSSDGATADGAGSTDVPVADGNQPAVTSTPVTASDIDNPEAPSLSEGQVVAGVEQVTIVGLPPGTQVELDGDNTATADDAGAILFRGVEPGARSVSVVGNAATVVVDVVDAASSLPDQSFYDGQPLDAGYQYLEMRDGTTLAASVYLPPGDGPFVTVVEYSGYSPARPGADFIEPIRAIGVEDPESLCESTPIVCNAPDQSGSLFAYGLDFAVVAVNMRGTGCSGGAFGYFDLAQRLDGYDVIEIVGAQSWVKNGRVGMVGLSYPGISQLFVAAEQPPSLAAIAPFSVFDDVARDVVSPGGVFNTGFAGAYSSSIDSAISAYGQGWEQELVDAGDTVCEGNQGLRGQNVDLLEQSSSARYYDPELAEPLLVSSFADQIIVPVLLAGAWQDAQIGSGGLDLADEFDNSPFVKVMVSNGSHADPWALETLTVWKDFLDLYVGGERRPIPPLIGGYLPTLLDEALFKVVAPLPEQTPITGTPAEQLAAFEAEPRITYLFERGGDAALPGAPIARYQHGSDGWLADSTDVATFVLGADGSASLDGVAESTSTATRFNVDPTLAELTTLPGEGPTTSVEFEALPPYQWQQEPSGSAAVFVSEPLAADLVWLGDAAANLWIRSSDTNADISVTISEVRPDGDEVYIQSGFLRAELRTRGADATETNPDVELLEADASPLVAGQWTEVSIPVPLTGHILRAGSQLRFSFHTPGGDRPTWAFELDPVAPDATIDIRHDAEHPSSISLMIAPSVLGYPDELPVCPGLRGQACRAYEPYENTEVPQ